MASTKFGVDISDIIKMQTKLKLMGTADIRPAIKVATSNAAKMIARDVARLSPVGTGRLKRNVYTDSLTGVKKTAAGSVVNIRSSNSRGTSREDGSNAFYWRWNEFGRKPKGKGKGQLAKHFVRTAFRINRSAAGNMIMRQIMSEVNRQWDNRI